MTKRDRDSSSGHELAPYHRWSDRQRRLFELVIQLLACIVVGCGVIECVGPPPSQAPCIKSP